MFTSAHAAHQLLRMPVSNRNRLSSAHLLPDVRGTAALTGYWQKHAHTSVAYLLAG